MRGFCATLLALLGLAEASPSIDVEAARSDAAAALVYASLAREAAPVPTPKPESEKVFHPFTPKVKSAVNVAPSCSGGQCRAPARRRPFRRRH